MNKYYKKKAYQKLGVTIARGAQRGSKELEISRGRKQATRRKSPKPSTAEKFHEANTLEDRVEIGHKVAELRIKLRRVKANDLAQNPGRVGAQER